MQLDAKMARLAGLGAYALAVGVVVVFLGFVWLVHPVPYGGENPTMFAVSDISVGAACLALIATHIALGNQLLKYRD